MLNEFKFRTQLLMSYAVILSFMIVIAVVVFFSVKSLEDDLYWVSHTNVVLDKASSIEISAINMETGMRGYLLAGKQEFLSPYEKGNKTFHELVNLLTSYVDDNPEQVELLSDISATIDKWRVQVTEPVIALRSEIGDANSMNDMAEVIKQAKGKEYFDKFRDQINTFIEREEALVAQRHQQIESSTNAKELKQLEALEFHSYRVITMALRTLSSALDMETGMRGFLLAGQERYLEPYKDGNSRFYRLIEELALLVGDDSQQISQLTKSKVTIDRWISEVVEAQILLRREIGDAKTMDDMAKLVGEAKGKTYFDKFRSQIQTFKNRELALRDVRQNSLENTESLLINITIFGTLLAIIIGFGIAFRLTKNIVDQLGGEPAYIAEIARQVSTGDLSVELKDDGETKGIFAEMKQMLVTLKDKAHLAQKIAIGELDQIVKLASEKDTLGMALKDMLENLNRVADQADAIAKEDFTKEIVFKSDKDRLGIALYEMKSQIKERNVSLLSSLSLNQGIVDTCLDAILSITTKGVIIACNHAAESLFQYRSEELIGRKINTLMPNHFSVEHDSYLNNYLTTGIKKIMGKGREVVGLKKDGSTFPIFLTIGQVEQEGEIIFTGFVRDITKEKQYESDLNKTNEDLLKQNELKSQVSKINELTQGASDLMVMADNIISALAEMMKAGHGVIYTYEQEDNRLRLTGSYAFRKRKAVLSFIDIGEGLVGQCAKERKTILLTQVPADYIQINSGLGQGTPLNVIVVPVLFEGELIGVIELASFKSFSDEQVDVIELISNNLGIVFNNLRNQQRTQVLLQETQSQSEILQTQQEELRSSNESLLEQTQLLKISEEELKQQAEELKVSNEELEEKQVFLKRQKDEIEAAKTDLTVKADELALASKYKSEFLANMSHELRTPLNSLLLLAKGLADNKNQHLDEVEVEDAKIIFDGGNNLLCLINDIMDLSKVEAGKLSIHIEEVNINVLSRNLKQVFDPIAKSRDLAFKIELDENLPSSVSSDGQRVEQILRNLLSNALKFTETGTVTLKIGYPDPSLVFSHSSLDVKNALSFAVIDTGIGIPSNKLQAIFEAFQQQDGSTSRKYGGTGLGLTIARELTRLLGGEIQLKSVASQGSTFSLFLPNVFNAKGVEDKGESGSIVSDIKFAVEPIEPITAESSQLLAEAMQSGSLMQPYPEFIPDDRNDLQEGEPRLLVIDDDPIFAKILRDHAREHGYQCLVAGDGRMGIYLAQEYLPNGIILDIMLPDIDGHQVLEQLKFSVKTRHIPVEIISAHDEDKNAALVQGAIGLQTKPVSQETLLAVFDEMKSFSTVELRHLLVIEDDSGNQVSIIRLLDGSDIDIKCVNNGTQGVKEILSGQYDCIILDLGLPDISGFEVLKQIESSELERVPPVIIYTGKEITDAEQDKLNKFSSTIVLKGVGSGERLLDDISLFLHDLESRFDTDIQKSIHMLHDEDAMFQGRKVLIVDDDMRNTYALSKKLIEVGFEVDMAHNGKEAVEQLTEDQHFELVLMDTMMPEMDGDEAIQLIREMDHYKKLPIIALTAKTMPEDRERSLQAGASEYLTKPIDFEKLLSIMRIWLFKH
jgi:PAS domain S-box-containing protein